MELWRISLCLHQFKIKVVGKREAAAYQTMGDAEREKGPKNSKWCDYELKSSDLVSLGLSIKPECRNPKAAK